MTYPGAHPQAFNWLFQARPLGHVMHDLPFQLDPDGHAQLLEEELHDWPFGQVMQATPFHEVLPGQVQVED